MTVSWRFIDFSLAVANEQTVEIDPSVLSDRGEKTIYYADQGKSAYELVIAHAKEFDAEEIIPIIKVAVKTKRKLIVLFHHRHYKLLNAALYRAIQMSLTPIEKKSKPDISLMTKLVNDIKSSALQDLLPSQIRIGSIYRVNSDVRMLDSAPIEINGGRQMTDLEDSILRKLDNISSTPNTEMDNEILLPRDVLLYGWLLQQQWGKIPWTDLVDLVGKSLMGNIRQFIRDHSRYFSVPPHPNMDNLVFSEALMTSIQNVFGDQKHFSITRQVPFFPDNVTGQKLVRFFVGSDEPAIPLSEMLCDAFELALGDIRVKSINKDNDIFRVL